MTDPNEIPIDEVSGVEERPQNRREWAGALRSLLLPVLIIATIVGGLLYWEHRDEGGIDNAGGGQGVVRLPDEKNVTGRSPSTDVGRAAPDFVLRTIDGAELRFSDLQGSPVLVNFWASWCAPCRKEIPDLVRVYDERKTDGLVVLAVNLQENAGQIRSFAEEFGMEFPIVIDRRGQVAKSWRIGGPIEGLPSSYFVDRQGVVRQRSFGQLTDDKLAAGLATILP